MSEMKHNAKEPGILQLTLALTLITGIAGMILGGVAYFTVPIQIKNTAKHEQEVLRQTLPQAESFEKIDMPATAHGHKAPNWYIGKSGDGQPVGYVIQTDKRGYGGTVAISVGVNRQFEIMGYTVLHHNETPGLGDQMKKPKFKAQFVGKTAETLALTKRSEPGKVNAITGATITSRAVVDGIKEALQKLKEHVGHMPKSEARHAPENGMEVQR